ncbi:hypothetical protein L3Q72_08465 [Vibrio sp. JC009]|uniref:hypothetical protein n=1 Tax=Vibrio sp. JC009 TaxID=2912314 RepID=UPI0023AEAA23|nr:hypothetical protein [Vibrio sp. JC009]WED20681.1 hypothetical protein L3Q72_08465 [Vibrio sp. JC009]
MNNIEKKIEAIFNQAFPEAELNPSLNQIDLGLHEPKLIGLSVQSASFEFAPEGDCRRVHLQAEQNGVPLDIYDDLAEHTEIKLDEGKLRIHDMSIRSVADFKRVIRQNYC